MTTSQEIRKLSAFSKNITIEKEGRRYYFSGNTYPIKDDIRSLGGKWDRDRRQWWVSSTMYNRHKDQVEALLGEAPNPATDKQVVYIHRLFSLLGERPPEKITFEEASALITDLKKRVKQETTQQNHVPTRGPSPSDRQISYAINLIRRLGRHGWHDSDYGQGGGPPPTRDDLEGWSKREVSDLIKSLKSEW